MLPAAPVNLTRPTITGLAIQGQVLTEHAGTWANAPTALSYLWLRCEAGECHAIEGATQSKYTVSASDAGDTIVAREAARNAGGWSAALSEPSLPVVAAGLAETPVSEQLAEPGPSQAPPASEPPGAPGEQNGPAAAPGGEAFGVDLLDFSPADW